MSKHEALEALATEVVNAFEIVRPPVPVESMLHNPVDDMWESVDIAKLSGSFMSLRTIYSPRISIARMLARHIRTSEWGDSRDADSLLEDKEELYKFARMILMPRDMVSGLTVSGRNPTTMSLQFEVPEEDARIRLQEIFG